jgi:hypothetical protein
VQLFNRKTITGNRSRDGGCGIEQEENWTEFYVEIITSSFTEFQLYQGPMGIFQNVSS